MPSIMKTRFAAKLLLVGTFIVVLGYGLRGHDILTAIFVTALFLTTAAKIAFALFARRSRRLPPGRGGVGGAGGTVPRSPVGRPPSLAASAEKPSF